MKLISFMALSFMHLTVHADPQVEFTGINSPSYGTAALHALQAQMDLSDAREVQIDLAHDGMTVMTHGIVKPNRALIMIFSKTFHRFDRMALDFDANGDVINVQANYQLKPEERLRVHTPHCPDPDVEFIAFAPNKNSFEQSITIGVANDAIAHHLKTVKLLRKQATKQNWLDYMSCPKLVGNFYDGDANPYEIVTADGTLSAAEMKSMLPETFRHRVTNIWLACQAYNNPVLGVVKDVAESQKFAAGKNDLVVGPSDQTAACAMKAALDGEAMTQAFKSCFERFDVRQDHWGFAGGGSDYFGK